MNSRTEDIVPGSTETLIKVGMDYLNGLNEMYERLEKEKPDKIIQILYRPDGKLVGLGKSGRVYFAYSRDGKEYWKPTDLRNPMIVED